jgi:hypothetical protein
MSEGFGGRLRQRREEQLIALSTIAEQTKIKLSLLEALERDDFSHWPTGIFRRAFVRAYAHAIGLEPDIVVREFLELHPDPPETIETVAALAQSAEGPGASGGPPTRLRYIVGSAIKSISRLRVEVLTEPTGVADELPEPTAPPAKVIVPTDPDLLAAAELCTELARADTTRDVDPLLKEAVRILDALGLVVWVWNLRAGELRPALAHGYSDKVLAQLPAVTCDADNATAEAFRSAQMCTVNGSDLASGALVVPLMTPAGCVGVLAIELQHGAERRGSTRALVTIFAAQLARLVAPPPADAVDRRLA